MWTPPPLLLPWLLTFLLLPMPSLAEVGTASFYGPPYLPTACHGSDEGQFPADNLFAAAGQGIWDNGASCGREYLVRCLSSATPDACAGGRTIQVAILDQAAALNSMPSRNGTTMVLSTTAFRMITQQSVDVINIEFTQV
ncbi:EG45-like domain containing protein [Phoenix dactylifera]|uniref:EG45-like domain containing protein n=1 Tax=Phoenix dactylifera TaxID=42345 RepID=A0A8B7CYY5_PHODC|nr:EG45-like domain containing protein [Phoenix dactylifera]